MRTSIGRTFSGAIAGWLICSAAAASDHADPLSLNPLSPPREREPRITDLHVFLDSDRGGGGKPTALVFSLSVFPSLSPLERARDDAPADGTYHVTPMGEPPDRVNVRYALPSLDIRDYVYRVRFDLHAKLGDDDSQGQVTRYGACFLSPADIAPEVEFEFALADDASLARHSIVGLAPAPVVVNADFVPGAINVRTGVFDDPFIFPRFFRTNVVAIVVSVPLTCFPAQQRDFVVWATSEKDGRQIDHVGRSQRTQVPRFDALNTLPPREHVAAIEAQHSRPTLVQDAMRTFLSPLFGIRPFDFAPDVLVFRRGENLERPTGFPNGRRLDDDVAALIGRYGDTQLLEASYTDDPRFPRATENDKPFRAAFPYLAPPWTRDEVNSNPRPFSLSRPTLSDANWRFLWLLETAILVVLAAILARTVRSDLFRIVVVLVAAWVIWSISDLRVDNQPMTAIGFARQPEAKLHAVLRGAGAIAAYVFALVFVLGRRAGESARCREPGLALGNEGMNVEDRQDPGSTFEAVWDAVRREPYYRVWGGPNEKPLPRYTLSLDRLLRGFLVPGKIFRFGAAQRRTLLSRADLRWGQDGKGFARLLHPNGVCLAGTWKIDDVRSGVAAGEGAYTGCFAPGARVKIVGRYSTCCTETRSGRPRSLSLAGKLFAPGGGDTANFLTQEDLGGTRTWSFADAVLTNSPPVTPWMRGFGILSFVFTGLTFRRRDEAIAERQLYEIAELGKPTGTATRCPRFLRLTVEGFTKGGPDPDRDFRDEVLGAIFDPGDPTPRRNLVFAIEVAETGERSGFLRQRVEVRDWRRIGSITFEDAVASYNGDYVIHFRHPAWRRDRNDPNSIARPELDPRRALDRRDGQPRPAT